MTAMQPIQWLLVGGPANGKTLWIKAGSAVRIPHENGEDYLYCGENYLNAGRLYRIGICHSEGDANMAAVPNMIEQASLQHIAGS